MGAKITPIILSGGSGTRLWPLSRKSYPKQFASLLDEVSLFQAAAQRLNGPNFNKPIIVTNSDFRFIITEQLNAIDIDADAIIIEPVGRNTGPAILASALKVADRDPNAVLLVAPSDHAIPDTSAFHDAIERARAAVVSGHLVTFGIKPSHPETGYGYLELSEPTSMTAVSLKRFIEKPNAQLASEMCNSDLFLWNAGIFMFRARDIIEAFSLHAPYLVSPVSEAVQTAEQDLSFCRLGKDAWDNVADISIDYAVMEKAENLSVVPFNSNWSDLGGWDAVWRESVADSDGVVTSGNSTAIDCSNSLIRSESETLEVVGIGLQNIVVVGMNDAVLVANMNNAQVVKKAVNHLEQKQKPQATQFPTDHRPWGWFESLVVGNRFQVKRIFVHPGASLSLQSHHHRAEHWIVVSGTAEVTIGEDVQLVAENQSVYIPLGTVHRLRNPGKVPMILIEVQTGAYLGEDDIIRYEDDYDRGQGAKG